MNTTRSRTVCKSADSGALTSEVEVGYTTRVLVQTLFPYKKPTDGQSKELVVHQGNTRITVYSPDGIPYGKYPRLIMAYIITEAVRRKDLPEEEARRIPLGKSMNEFMERMGLTSRASGGSTGSIRNLREQLGRLVSSSITVRKVTVEKNKQRDSFTNVNMINHADLWFTKDADQLSLQGSYLELTTDFYREILKHPIPIDLGMLKSLSKPRAMDLFIWATTRKYWLKQPLTLDWDQVQAQFGPNTPTTSRGKLDFKKRFCEAIDEVNQIWPGADLSYSPEGMTLPPGTPSITPRTSP
ncbi:replication protein RepA [Corynebacterium mastitidis]|uniref:replication protein RepA n=1 Tax=Corynebacterium mastitidis TaxID=161890 RepID=UPI00037F3987|nr:replication protein RepA [Corynebacterium mastitidis]